MNIPLPNLGEPTKEPKDLRYRKIHFPQAEEVIFSTSRKGFVPLPILMRKLMRHLSAPEFRVLAYLHLRASKYGICYPTQQEMAYELGLEGTKNLTPHLRSLERKRLISTKTSLGRKFYLVHDPRIGLLHLAGTGQIRDDELDAINELCIDLGQELISARRAPLPPLQVMTNTDSTTGKPLVSYDGGKTWQFAQP
jgi:hypothetical protein